jgi:diaminohydroxyphosphoribosylaminopyrimidine deaminase/5-amino-6-(5-phosphoribosylamino)uracil reductase
MWISNPRSRRDAHRLRRRTQAIIAGINTVISDNPLLTPRPSMGKSSLRVVLDRQLRIALTSRLLATADRFATLVVTTQEALSTNAAHVRAVEKTGAEILSCPSGSKAANLECLLAHLGRRGIQQVLVEGGPTVHAAFLQAGLMDELCIYLAPQLLGAQGAASIAQALAELPAGVELTHATFKGLDGDLRCCAYNASSVAEVLAF